MAAPAEARKDKEAADTIPQEKKNMDTWAAIRAAMGDLGFSIIPKFGSVFTFLPPGRVSAVKSFTMHRPHKSNIEG